MTLEEIMALIEAAETIYQTAANAINSSTALSADGRQTLIARIKSAQAAVPEWE